MELFHLSLFRPYSFQLLNHQWDQGLRAEIVHMRPPSLAS